MDELYFIFTGEYVGDAMLWWRGGHSGYTTRIKDAGKYNYADAKDICSDESRLEQAYPIQYILDNIVEVMYNDSLDVNKKIQW